MKRTLKVILMALVVISSTISVKNVSATSSRVQSMLENMTKTEKVAQMIQADTRWITPEEVAEYKIGSILSGGGAAPSTGNTLENWADSLNSYQQAVIDSGGVPLLYGIDAVHGNNNLYGATIYPHNIGLAAANDATLVEDIGVATTSEVQAMGANWVFTPTLGIPHNERWGRTYETFGDDVDRVTSLGSAYIRGIEQGGNVIASAKHFLAEGLATNGTNQGNIELSNEDYQALINADMSNPLVKEVLTPYKKAIEQGVDSIMITYNSINGKKCHGNKDVVTTLLKENLGFDGIVVSDYNGLDQIENASTYKDKAVACINAGVDVLMVAEADGNTPRWKNLYNALVEAVNENLISEDRLNDAVTRILTVKEKLGLLDDYSKAFANSDEQALFGGEEHRNLARQAVSQSLVLLKNDEVSEGQTIMQALGEMDNIMVAGSAGDDIGKQCGGWTITWQGATGNTTEGTTIFSGIKAAMEAKGGIANYSANGVFTDSNQDIDAAIVIVGEDPYAESSGDRSAGELKLPANDINTINNIKNAHPDLPIVLVLVTGRPIAIADYVGDSQVKGVVNAWLPGSEGAGVSDVLIGDKDFTGSNPITWTWYPQDIENKYRDESTVLYPVGYKLTKDQKTGDQTVPNDPATVDLKATNGKLEAEAFKDKHASIVLENNGTSVGYLQDGRYLTYKINVPEKAAYKLTVNAAREYSDTIDGAFELYLDNELVLARDSTKIVTTGSWTNFNEQVMNANVSLKDGVHELKFVARAKDFNIDYFLFEKAGDYVGPVVPEEVTNVGTGALLKEDAIQVTMSSSENSQDMSWYKGEYEISNKNATKDALDLRAADDSMQTTIVVNDQKQYQTALGMGTSLEESTIHNLLKMDKENREAFLRRLIDPVNGMGMTLIRITIGTSDFTAQDFYTYYDGTGKELNGQPDWYNTTGKGFSIQKDIDYGVIQVINELQEIAKEIGVADDLKFFASSWTPPGWMKIPTSSSNSYANNELLLKGGQLNDDHINDLAKYYVRYIEEYKKQGINIYAMTLQNEPMLEIDYPSCAMTGAQEAKIAKAVKQELAKSEVLTDEEKDVKLWAFDHNFNGADSFMKSFFDEAGDELNIDGIAFHPYGGNASTMGAYYEKYKDQLSMNLTERSVWGTSGANDIITWLRNGSESYNSWVTMLDSNIATHHWVGTPDPTLFVQDANNPQRYWATPEVYIMSQFTKYVRPGFVRIDTNNGSSSSVTNVAFKNPETGEIVMIVTNCSGKDQKFKVMMNGTQFNAVLPAGNVATYIWNSADAVVGGTEIPGTLTPGSAVSTNGVTVKDDGSGFGNIEDGASIDYLINVKEAGIYDVTIPHAIGPTDEATVTSNSGNKEIILKNGDTVIGKTVTKRFDTWSKDWEAWGTTRNVKVQVKLEAGLQRMSLVLPSGDIDIGALTITKARDQLNLPGYVDALEYSYGENIIVEDGNIGFFDDNDKVEYTVNVQKDGSYEMKLNYAKDEGNANFDIYVDDIQVGEATFAATGDFSKYEIGKVKLDLTKGSHRIAFVPKNNGGFNLKSLTCGAYIKATSDQLLEGDLDGQEITVKLTDGKFVADLSKDNWKLANLPAGIDYTVTRKSDDEAIITLKGQETVDYDQNLRVDVEIDAKEIADNDYILSDSVVIEAVNDDESLGKIDDVAFDQDSFDITIDGGKFNQDLSVADLALSDEIAEYLTISDVLVSDDASKATISFKRNATNYEDVAGSITVKASGYSDDTKDLIANLKLIKTDAMPEAIVIGDSVVSLSETDAYRKKGTLVNGNKGDYVDFYLGIQTEGNYLISYRVKDSEAVNNALKLSGGLGLATDNIGSVSFGKFWGNSQGYVQMLNLKTGDQTLRFEVNNAGFELTDLKIEKLTTANQVSGVVGDKTTITVDSVVDGSKDIGWALEGNDVKNVGFGAAGAYQDYYLDVQKSGTYAVKVNYSHDCGGDTKAVIMNVDNNQTNTLGEIVLKNTGGWSSWKDSDTVEIHLNAGKQFIRIYDDLDGFNYRNFELTCLSIDETTVDKSALVEVVDYATTITDQQLENVIPSAVMEFKAALQEAKDVLANQEASQDQVDLATARLNKALTGLDQIKGDKTALQALVADLSQLTGENYSEASYQIFKEALQKANDVLADENAQTVAIENAYDQLLAAFDGLQLIVDKFSLQTLVDTVSGLNQDSYTEKSWQELISQLENAQAVLVNEKASQDDINEAYGQLLTVYQNLELKANKEALKELVDKAGLLQKDRYSEKSWQNFDRALQEAKAVLANEDASDAMIQAAIKDLQAAIDDLETVKVADLVTGNSSTTTTSKTGDDVEIILPAATMAAAMALYLSLRKRRQHK